MISAARLLPVAAKRPGILITHWVPEEVIDRLLAVCDLIVNASRDTWERDRVLDLARRCEGMIAFMPDRIDEVFLSRCPRLSVIAFAVAHVENCDFDACTRHGVWVTCAAGARNGAAMEAAETVLDVLAGRRPRGAANEPAHASRSLE
jgi:lactate dehydrogenase-like 2-hydroxyacid dehydrogenase